MARNLILAAITGLGVALVGGCRPTHLEAAFSASLEEVDAIRDDASLAPQEKRDALAALGFDAVTINGLLSGVRLANQFGGDLTTAFEKVTNDRFSELTPDEVQAYGDATGQTTYSDDEAQAIVFFFDDNNINSAQDLQSFLDDPATELPAGIDETDLTAVFITTSPDDVRDKLP